MTQHDGLTEFNFNDVDWWPEDRVTIALREAEKPSRIVWPAPGPDPAIEWHEVTLPRLIAEGAIIDRGPDFRAQGFSCRHVYA